MVKRLFAPVDIAPLIYARIAFGVMIAIELVRYFALGRVRAYYVQPDFFFTFWGFDWVRPLPGIWMYAAWMLLTVCALLVAVGLWFRVAAVVLAVGVTYAFLLDQTHYLNHMYLICILAFCVAATPAADAGSLDARRNKKQRQWAPLWAVRLIPVQLGIVYVFGGVAKLDLDWLKGLPARNFLAGFEPTAALADHPVAPLFLAYSGLMFDLLVVPALLWRRTRWPATAAAVLFHVTNANLFHIGIFPWLMLSLTPLFWPPPLLRRLLSWARILPEVAGPAPTTERPRRGHLIVAALALHAVVQLFMPLRHWLYPGQVNWTEEGHNFSWHMKLRVKSGKTWFVVRDRKTGQEHLMDPRFVLTPRQTTKMSTRPDMILFFAHELGARARLRGLDPEIRARAFASLNGRPVQYLVDPQIDLLTRPRGVWPADWIVPLGGGPPVQQPQVESDMGE